MRRVVLAKDDVPRNARRRIKDRLAVAYDEALEPAEVDLLHQFDEPLPGGRKVPFQFSHFETPVLEPGLVGASVKRPKATSRFSPPATGIVVLSFADVIEFTRTVWTRSWTASGGPRRDQIAHVVGEEPARFSA